MAYLELAGHRLHYRIDGEGIGSQEKPWLMFCNSLGTDLHMWDGQISELSRGFRILRYDSRGHGLSSAPSGPYALSDLGNDAIALLDGLNIDQAHFCGLSIGGLTGQWLGIHAGTRLGSIAVCATAAKIGTAESWAARIDFVRANGLAALKDATVERWFTPQFQAARPDTVAAVIDSFVATSIEGYIGCCAALAEADLRENLRQIVNPVLAVSGDCDPVCPPNDLEDIAACVQRGTHLSLSGRHIVNMASEQAFNTALISFLTIGPDGRAAMPGIAPEMAMTRSHRSSAGP
ncbi:3-oxoadipate enol-lactonase 2 (plasmid) [Rhizobium etli 8C-3]|uniref:3-oxoadipate enol-lactonase 2 n=1 Tax=Rhizobium etli 8C-3 TaxID=538025 RepID=A0A1L5PHD9_RHIET|nr:3-oxoadipate enol-lactonase [Rhizobium etli]APO79628.1 3-oxoadipate enol-lactonase 2 [Rhizobium etli 8C-3]